MSNIMSVCLYSCLSYAERKSHIFCSTLYCQLQRDRLYSTFPHYLINSTVFGKKSSLTQNVCFDFLYTSDLKHLSPNKN